ncbi:Alpha/Beta hydrolase protein [Clohesyomyces aquaticus]|uniref:Alpha/Beta hydrolase protein n=1 Tax=Clohesyomyces aquaticus TaxID=1231657 RepID=A0A1Y1Z7M8_9PLEO|nr:Alpha/Beta hydrolase protein [Clohesyomyces aquaticus]
MIKAFASNYFFPTFLSSFLIASPYIAPVQIEMACRDCFRGGKATGDPQGEISTLHGLSTYVASPATPASDSTIIFYTDAFGLRLVNNKLLADAYAHGTGLRVLVPDIIPGGPCDPAVMEEMDVVLEPITLTDIWGHIRRVAAFFRVLSYYVPFFWRAFPSNAACFNPCLEYARKVKAELPPGAKLGVAGFCWGGYQSVNLCAQPTVEGGSERLIDAEFCAHPSGLKLPTNIVDAITKFKTPFAMAHGNKDFAVPTKQVEEAEAILRQQVGRGEGENGVHYQIKHYDGMPHGFAVRARPEHEDEGKGADEAKEQAIEWFKKWL